MHLLRPYGATLTSPLFSAALAGSVNVTIRAAS